MKDLTPQPGETAKNFFELNVEAGIDRKKTVVWNAVPWYIGDGQKIRAATPKDLDAGLRPLPRLLALLPGVDTVVLVGRKAQKAARQFDRGRYAIFTCPHPSPMFVNRSAGNRGRILDALRQVGLHLRIPADGLASLQSPLCRRTQGWSSHEVLR